MSTDIIVPQSIFGELYPFIKSQIQDMKNYRRAQKVDFYGFDIQVLEFKA